ncbi:MAG: DUF1194 domain-containing protein [Amphiplicatus sp.]
MKNLVKAVAGAAAGLSLMMAPSAQAGTVDLELQLLVDVSGSISSSEFDLQRDGYAAAFQSAAVKNAIANGAIGSIAVQLVYWSTSAAVAVDWYEISDAASADAFAALVAAAPRSSSGSTGPGTAINFGVPLFDNNGFDSTRQVIDVSGDGTANTGANTAAARDAALAAGIDSINGITIGGGQSLQDWYLANIVGGVGGFLTVATGFDDFAQAILGKLVKEISGEIPLPAALPFLLTGLAGLGAMTRRRRKTA